MAVAYHTTDGRGDDVLPLCAPLLFSHGRTGVNDETCKQLDAINRRFYARVAAAFSESRDHPWPGWARVLEPLAERSHDAVGDTRLRLLDVGCGNGRFAEAAHARLGAGIHYLGVDASQALLDLAADRLAARLPKIEVVLVRLEITDACSIAKLPAGPFDCIGVFGLLHHLPSRARRRALLHALADRLAPAGQLALAAWRFADNPRFRSRRVSWIDYNAHASEPVDTAQLEPGDHLLKFGAAGEDELAIRYCHDADDAEIDAWLSGLPVRQIDRFEADGRSGDLNHYRVLERPGSG